MTEQPDQADSLGPPENSGCAAYRQPAGLADIKGRLSSSYMELRPGGLFKSPQFDSDSRIICNRHQIDSLRFGAPAGATASPFDRRDVLPNLSRTEKPLRYDRMSGLDAEQLDELVWRIEDQLEGPWHKGIGRPKDLSLREAVVSIQPVHAW
jgi:hypothetical protein